MTWRLASGMQIALSAPAPIAPACACLRLQIVGRAAAVARDIMDSQAVLPFIVTAGMHAQLYPTVAAELQPVGSLPLRCFPGQREECYTLARYAALPLTLPTESALEMAPSEWTAAAGHAEAAAAGSSAAAEAANAAGPSAPQQAAASAVAVPHAASGGGEVEPEAGSASAAAHKAGKGEDRRLLQRLAAERRRQRAAAKGGSSSDNEVVHRHVAYCKYPALLASAAQLSKQEAALRKGASSSLPRNTSR